MDQALKDEVSRQVFELVEEIESFEKVEIDAKVKQIITEVLWKKFKVYGKDLERFSKHAKRTTVNPDDVRLLLRQNEGLLALIETHIKQRVQKMCT